MFAERSPLQSGATSPVNFDLEPVGFTPNQPHGATIDETGAAATNPSSSRKPSASTQDTLQLANLESTMTAFASATNRACQEVARIGEEPTSIARVQLCLGRWLQELTLAVMQTRKAWSAVEYASTATPDAVGVASLLNLCIELQFYKDPSADGPSTLDEFLNQYINCLNIDTAATICNRRQLAGSLDLLWSHQRNLTGWGKTFASTEKKIAGSADIGAVMEPFETADTPVTFVHVVIAPLMQLNPELTIPLCAKKFPVVQPWNVRTAVQPLPDGDRLFLDYLDKLMNPEFTTEATMDARATPGLVHEWVELLLRNVTAPAGLFRPAAGQDTLGRTTPSSQGLHVSWPRDTTFRQVIDCPDIFSYDSAVLARLFHEAGYWHGVLTLLERLESTEEQEKQLLSLYLHLGEIDKLSYHISGDERCWNSVLDLMAKKDAVYWQPITFEAIFVQMGLQLGSLRALSIGFDHPEKNDTWQIPVDLYSRFCKAEEYSAQQSSLAKEIVVALDCHLWSKRSDLISPQLRTVVEREVQGQLEVDDKSIALASRAATLSGSSTTLEDPCVHWGVPVKIAGTRCPCCTLLLAESGQGTTLVFRCGHAFHTSCVSEDACLVCFAERQARTQLGVRANQS